MGYGKIKKRNVGQGEPDYEYGVRGGPKRPGIPVTQGKRITPPKKNDGIKTIMPIKPKKK